tara:strand:+ start:4006 stop:5790 length:1785 start_codon:yes stop_codon:yes gene_type:complete
MPLNETATLHQQDSLRSLAQRLDASGFGLQGELIQQYAALYNVSKQTVYRRLKKIGWDSGRKRRADAGTSSQDEQALTDLCATLRLGVRKNGKVTMETPNARSMLQANGRSFTVSNARLNQLLRERGLTTQLQKQDRPWQAQRSLHPNHVHMVDPSLCLIYYLKDGSQHIIRDDESYKNKPENIEKLKHFKVWRYVLVDHYSCTIIVRYYQSHGETQANLYDFLLHCWSQLDSRPFHGVPKILVWDKGSANTAKAIKCALRALDVNAHEHEAGNPRAKGSVEWANNQVEKSFESRLRYEPVACVDELNTAAEAWYNAYNANVIPHYDSRLKRPGMREPVARYALWQIIRKEQLRILPDVEVCRYLLSADPIDKQVKADLSVSFRHPCAKRTLQYDLSHIEHIYPRCTISISPLVYGDNEIIVYCDDYNGEEYTYIVTPVAVDEFSGFRHDAAIIGEGFKSKPDTLIEQQGKRADQAAFPNQSEDEIKKSKDKNAVPFEGKINSHSHLADVMSPAYMRRPGSELDVPNRMQTEIKPLSVTEASKRLVAELGQIEGVSFYTLVGNQFPDGITEEQLRELISNIRRGQYQPTGTHYK